MNEFDTFLCMAWLKKKQFNLFFYSSLLLLFITYKDCVYFAAFLFFAFIFVLYFLLLNATGSILHSLDGSLELWLPELNCNSAKKQPIQLFSFAIDLDKWLQSSRLEDEKVHHEAKHLAQRAIRFRSLGGFLPEFGTFHQMGVQFGLQFCSISQYVPLGQEIDDQRDQCKLDVDLKNVKYVKEQLMQQLH